MITVFRYAAFVMALFLLGATAPEAMAQKPRKAKGSLGPDGIKKGEVATGNADRQMLLEKQKAIASAKTSGGMTSGAAYSMPDTKFDTGVGRFTIKEYKTKSVPKRAQPKKSKRLIDQDNPDGRIYQQTLNKRERKFLIF
ncbi:hypothetical protein [Rufibacter soli]|jgi:hypothetical protein